MKIYHNARCRKSRETLQIIRDAGVEPEVVEYLKTPLTRDELDSLCQKLGLEPEQLIRRKEAIFRELYKGKELSRDQWLEAMVEHPKLMERPIVVEGAKAVLGRPPEQVRDLLG